MISPKQETVDASYVKDYEKLYKEVQDNPEAFWEKIANELEWYKLWDKVLDWNYPYARWFTGAQCNIVHNALDRHMSTPVKDKLAYIWEGQPQTSDAEGPVRKYTYTQLNEEVCRFANALKSLGLKKGDRVSIYLPRIPEQFVAMLACAKIGVVHSVVFSGFSIQALKMRIIDAQAKIVICTDGYPYKSKIVESKKNVDEAIKDIPEVQHVVVVNRLGSQGTGSPYQPVSPSAPPVDLSPVAEKQYHWYHELIAKQGTECQTEIMQATDPLFILYTSGSTGKPKGVIHSQAGYMVGTYITLKYVFNLAADDVYFCTADSGWITGHSYIVYSPLMNGVTSFVYESTPDYPDAGIWWKLVQKYKITKFYTAPTAVRALMRLGDEFPNKYDLSSLKILGSVGEPINPEAWVWYHKVIGKERCPIMDTWWQTETGMFMITPAPSVPLKPGSAFKPFFGVEADIVDAQGNPVPVNTQGYLVIKKPWPSMLMDVYHNPQRYLTTYFQNEEITNPAIAESKQFFYFSGDSAKKDEDGYFWIVGRNDDVIKVSGHRLGSAELESALVAHKAVAEAAVIGKPDEITGESIKAFVILKKGFTGTDELKKELVNEMRNMIGPIATPKEMVFVDSLPKTRSGKIMRRVLKAKELGLPLGDTSTLEN